jgi:hypothetical protein
MCIYFASFAIVTPKFSLDDFATYTLVTIIRTIMVTYFSSRKSSANYLAPRVFAQKGFDISIFGHFFCPFSQNFFDSCANEIEI